MNADPWSPEHVDLTPMRWWHVSWAAEQDRQCFGATAWTPAGFLGELARPSRRYRVALLAGEPVGYAGLAIWTDGSGTPPAADLQTLVVDRQARGRGIGTRLLVDAISAGRDADAVAIHLEVRTDSPALRLYQTHGFRTVRQRRDYYAPGEHAAVMVLPLTAQATTP